MVSDRPYPVHFNGTCSSGYHVCVYVYFCLFARVCVQMCVRTCVQVFVCVFMCMLVCGFRAQTNENTSSFRGTLWTWAHSTLSHHYQLNHIQTFSAPSLYHINSRPDFHNLFVQLNYSWGYIRAVKPFDKTDPGETHSNQTSWRKMACQCS